MSDDRWSIKGSDPTVKEDFDKRKREYIADLNEEITNEEVLQMLLNDVDIRYGPDEDEVRRIVREEINDALDELTARH